MNLWIARTFSCSYVMATHSAHGAMPMTFCSVRGCTARVKVSEYGQHMQRYHPGATTVQRNRVACTLCGTKLLPSSLTSHMQRTHGGRRVACKHPECKKTYKSIAEANDHYKHVHERKYMRNCTTCGQTVSKAAYRYHYERNHELHETPCPYAAQGCGDMLTVPGSTYYKAHKMQCRYRTERFECAECGKSYKVKLSMQNHMATVHGVNVRFRCECKLGFYGRAAMRVHQRKSGCTNGAAVE